MTHRAIDKPQAFALVAILFEECGWSPGGIDVYDFVHRVATDGCDEYRFQGAFGFGGKFRNNGNFNNTPYVDCYGEDETAERRAMINRANERIAVLFKDAP